MQTRITKLLEIEYPVIQGGMAWVANAALAANVSKAGGIGFIGAANAPAEWVRSEIRRAKEITDKPIGVNVMLLSEHVDEVAQVVAEEGVKAVTTGAGNPAKYMKQWKEAGIRVMSLLPQVVDAVSVPVIGAGGIGDGRGMAAALMLGAEAVQLGTRFIVAKESTVSQAYKDRVIGAKDIDSVVTGRSTGHPVRSLRNTMTRQYLEMEKNNVSFEELEHLTLGALRKAVVDGDVAMGTVMAGQIAGMIKKEQTCAEIIQEIVQEAKETIKKCSIFAEDSCGNEAEHA